MPKQFDWMDIAEAMQGPEVKKEEPKGLLGRTMDMIMDSMKDQTGLFRGGAEGRVFGRAKDVVEGAIGGFNKGPAYSIINEEAMKDITSNPDNFYGWVTKNVNPSQLWMVRQDLETYLGPDEGREFFKQNYDVHRMNREILGRFREINPSPRVRFRDPEKMPEWIQEKPKFVGPDTRIEDVGY